MRTSGCARTSALRRPRPPRSARSGAGTGGPVWSGAGRYPAPAALFGDQDGWRRRSALKRSTGGAGAEREVPREDDGGWREADGAGGGTRGAQFTPAGVLRLPMEGVVTRAGGAGIYRDGACGRAGLRARFVTPAKNQLSCGPQSAAACQCPSASLRAFASATQGVSFGFLPGYA